MNVTPTPCPKNLKTIFKNNSTVYAKPKSPSTLMELVKKGPV